MDIKLDQRGNKQHQGGKCASYTITSLSLASKRGVIGFEVTKAEPRGSTVSWKLALNVKNDVGKTQDMTVKG